MKFPKWPLVILCMASTLIFCDIPSMDVTSPAPSLTQSSENYKKILTETALMVLGLIGFILLTIYILKKLVVQKTFQMNRERHIKVIERRPLSAKTSLYLIQIGEEKIFLTESHLDVRSHKPMIEDQKPENPESSTNSGNAV